MVLHQQIWFRRDVTDGLKLQLEKTHLNGKYDDLSFTQSYNVQNGMFQIRIENKTAEITNGE
jgi:hypothetical protein